MPDLTDKYVSAAEYSARVSAYFGEELPRITAAEVLAELPKRCGAGQQYTTFPNTISDDDIAALEAEGLIITKNTVHGVYRDGASDVYVGFQVALTDLAVEKAMVISEVEANGIGSGNGGGGGGGGGSATLISKAIYANGNYSASADGADGYSSVSVDVPNTYEAGDEGKVVSNGSLVAQSSGSTSQNGVVDTTLINSLTVGVPNTYTAGDEGKVVSSGALVAQGSGSTTQNGVVDTTLINSLTVAVPGIQNLLTSGLEVGTISSDGNLIDNPCRLRTVDFTVLSPGTYTLMVTSTTILWVVFAFRYSMSGVFIERIPYSWTYSPYTFTVSEESKFKFIFSDYSETVQLQPSYAHNLMLLNPDG